MAGNPHAAFEEAGTGNVTMGTATGPYNRLRQSSTLSDAGAPGRPCRGLASLYVVPLIHDFFASSIDLLA